MREILLMLFLFSIIYSKTFLIKTKFDPVPVEIEEDPKAKSYHGQDDTEPKILRLLKKFNRKCKGQNAASKSKFCRKWKRKW